jgi:predicted lactoylglutathione lyase
VEQRISLITLGVRDVASAKAFYERLGWKAALDIQETVFFQLGQMVLTLWGRDKLAEDSGVTDAGGWGGVTLAHNVGSTEEVDRVIEEARTAGARIAREPTDTFYGGYAGVFLDLDGHPWEVAYNPSFELRSDGALVLPPNET